MNAVEFILDNINPMQVLEHYKFRHITETGDSIRACCEIHKGDSPTAFIWKKSNNLWYCYTGDCHGGDVFHLIQKMEGVGFTESVKIAANILGLDITDMTIKIQSNLVKKNTMKWLEMMKNINGKRKELSEFQLPFTKYYETDSRFTRFTKDTLSFYNAKFCTVFPLEDMLLYNKLVIPIITSGVMAGVALRDVTGVYHPKWYYQPTGLEIKNILYNYDVVLDLLNTVSSSKKGELILVEGIFDVWAYHEIGINNVVAIFGSSLKKEQEKILLKNNYTITLSFDNDNVGHKCTKDTYEKLHQKADLKVITLPDGYDPADCTKEELLECYLKRQ